MQASVTHHENLVICHDIGRPRPERVNLKNEPIILPPNCLNHDGLFIDDLTIADIQDRLGVEVLQGEYSFAETIRMVA